MPEGDVVARAARRLTQALGGRPLERVDLRWGELDGDHLAGRSTIEVASRGKHLLHRIEGGWTLHSHLRMEGSWRILATTELTTRHRSNPQIRALLQAPEWTALGLRLGMLDLVPTAAEATLVGHLGPDILGPDWEPGVALANLQSAGDRAIAEALLDQRNLAGIGTLYCSEALFLQRLHPWARVDSFTPEALDAVVARARRLMLVNLDHAIQSTTGDRRRGHESYVHARSGRPCRRCGDIIRVAPLGTPPRERVFFSCPTCQGGPAPTDTGSRQTPLGSSRSPSGRGRAAGGGGYNERRRL